MEKHSNPNRPSLARRGVVALAAGVILAGGALVACTSWGSGKSPAPATAGCSAASTPRGGKVWDYRNFDTLRIAQPDEPVYNNEEQTYTPDNVRTEDCNLVLTARHNPQANKTYTSGKVDSRDHFSFEYGTITARMQLPAGKGTWPAFWLLSQNQVHSNNDPQIADRWQNDPYFYLMDGEIDIMEAAPRQFGTNTVESTWQSYSDKVKNQLKQKTISGIDITKMHDYSVTIEPNAVKFSVDGNNYHTIHKPKQPNPDSWPTGNGNKYYFILNLAMGGEMGGRIDKATADGQQVRVQHVIYTPY